MKKFIMLGVAALMSVAMMAQNGERPNMGRMVKNRAEQLAKELDLKKEAKEQFEALYVQYATELAGERQERRRNADAQGEGRKGKRGEMTEAQATERLQQMLERQEQQIADQQRRLEVMKKYVAEFQKTLTPQQVLKVMQPMQRQHQGMPGGQRMGGQRMGGPQGGFGGGHGFGGGEDF